jgi:hypothetical protein
MDTLDGYALVIPVWVPGQRGTDSEAGLRRRAVRILRRGGQGWRADIGMYLSRGSMLQVSGQEVNRTGQRLLAVRRWMAEANVLSSRSS